MDLAVGHLSFAASLSSEPTRDLESARVRSTVSSRSISAKLAMTWKKKRPEGVPVSIASVRLLNLDAPFVKVADQIYEVFHAAAKAIQLPTQACPRRASISMALMSPGRSPRLPLILSSKIFLQPAWVRASICRPRF